MSVAMDATLSSLFLVAEVHRPLVKWMSILIVCLFSVTCTAVTLSEVQWPHESL